MVVGAPVILPHATEVTLTSVTAPSASAPVVTLSGPMVGAGYVPVRSPEAAPEGGKLAGAPVTFDHATSEISALPTAPAAIVGFGYVDPARSPPAGPEGGSVVGMVGGVTHAVA